jgi:hypothetical protein
MPAARYQQPAPAAPGPTPRAEAPPAPVEKPTARVEAPALKPETPKPEAPPARGGWLSDLLSRASRDDQPARDGKAIARPEAKQAAKVEVPVEAKPEVKPEPKAETGRASTLDSLNTISGDIARMVDHEAAVDMWERYRGGEQNVFSRRLYTLQGQQTFEEIRRKYRRDGEFKQTVDRYVDEFERLLAEVSRDDRDDMLSRTYLTSETGKVYTMLAHASGRLDG